MRKGVLPQEELKMLGQDMSVIGDIFALLQIDVIWMKRFKKMFT